MQEFKGHLMGGPDDGNLVTIMRNRIPVVSTTEMWLEGEGENATVTIVVTRGTYVWDDINKCFIWEHEVSNVYSKKAEAA